MEGDTWALHPLGQSEVTVWQKCSGIANGLRSPLLCISLGVLLWQTPSSAQYHSASGTGLISKVGSGLCLYFRDVEAERQSKGDEPMVRNPLFSKAGCKSVIKDSNFAGKFKII